MAAHPVVHGADLAAEQADHRVAAGGQRHDGDGDTEGASRWELLCPFILEQISRLQMENEQLLQDQLDLHAVRPPSRCDD